MATDLWPRVPLGELTENFDGRRVPVKESERRPGPFPYYGASGVVDHVDGYLFDGEYLLIGEDGENLRNRQTPIAFLATGKFWVNNHAHIVRGNHRAHTRYLCYALSQTEISGYLTGSTMPKLTQANLRRLPIVAPPLPEQHAIASVLGALDDKIDLNRRMCQTLEEMARALFKSWFIDFDTVRAKMEGRDPGLPKEVAELFPSRLVDSELGPIPEGWWVQTFDEVLTISRSSIDPQEHQAERFAHYSIPAFDAGMRAAIEIGESIKSQKFLVSDRHVLISKLNPRTPRVWLLPQDGQLRQIASTEFLVCEPRHESGYTRTILYHAAASTRTTEFLAGNATGTSNSHQRVRPSDFRNYAFASPAIKLLRAFSAIAEPLHARIAAARSESHTLAQTRHTLLPKLISGELRVPASLGSMQEVTS